MTGFTLKNDNRLGWALTGIAFVVIFAAFTFWGGIPGGDQSVAFWAQIGALFLILCAFALTYWHLLLRPLAPGLRAPLPDTLDLRFRQGIAIAQTGGLLAIVISAVWDELWHRQFGIPFGEDFFWPPHLLMYFGFITIIGIGIWSLRYLNRQLRGNFQQRFRANKVIGLYILNAAFLIYALAADPIWHWTFGEDLTAWSVPHLILLASIVLSICLSLYVFSTTKPPPAWRGIFKPRGADALPLLLLASGLLVWLQLMLIDWDATLMGIPLEWLGLYRPEWLLAANLVACVTFTGIMATRLLRAAGAATVAGLLALALRFGLIQLLDTDLLQHIAWVAALLPLLAIDLWTWYCAAIRKREADWRGTAMAVILAMLPNALFIRGAYGLDDVDNLAYILAVAITALGMGWFSHQIAGAMRRKRADLAELANAGPRIAPPVSVAVLGGFLVCISLVIVTAPPPV